MSPIEKAIYDNYGYLIKVNEKGEKYVDSDDIYSLSDIRPEEKGFMQMILRLNGIAVRVKKITKEDRTGRVKDDNYGDVQGNDLVEYDEPVKAVLNYSDSNLVFENYEELDEYLESDFIPNKVRMKINRNGRNINEKGESYPSIQLNEIVKLKLSELENKHVIEYLNNQGIRVAGVSQDYDSEFEQYDYTRTYGNSIKEYVSIHYKDDLTPEEMFEKFVEYQNTKDPVLREELILRNYRLVPYVAWKLALKNEVNQGDVEGYGYEGLIHAVDSYNPYMGASFATYAVSYLAGYIKNFIPELKNIHGRNLYYQFRKAKYIVERDWGAKYEEVPEMLDDILDLFIEVNGYLPKNKEVYRKMFTGKTSFEKLDIDSLEFATDDDLDEVVQLDMLRDSLEEAMSELNDKERIVLELRFGLKTGYPMTLGEVGKIFNVTRERIRQIECKALRRLRNPARSKKLRNYYDIGVDLDNRRKNSFR